MANISILARLQSGVLRNIDMSANTLVVAGISSSATIVTTDIKVGGATGTVLTKAILDNLILLQAGGDAGALHNHNGAYYQKTEIGATTGTSGASLVGVSGTPTNYTAATADVQAHLAGIDTALATAGATTFTDDVFAIQNAADNTKQILFNASAISAATSRTITMPDSDVNLGDIATNTAAAAAAQATADAALPKAGGTMSGAIAMGGNAITGMADPSLAQDAATKNYVDTQDALKLSLSGGTMSGAIAMGGNAITGLPLTPTAANEAVSKSYADGLSAGVITKQAVRVATAAALPAVTAAGSGVGKTLTANANGALTIDGVAVAANDRVLIKDQANAADNGIYDVTDAGSAGTPFILTRSSDADGSPSNEVQGGNTVFVDQGTVNANTSFKLDGVGNKVVDTDALNWLTYSRAEAIVAGTGISKTGLTLDVTLTGLTTDNLTEGTTNLYYTQARFDSAFGAKTTTDLAEGTNLYFTDARAIAAPLTGFTSGAGTVAATDSVLAAIQKVDGNIAAHIADTANPHSVTKAQILTGNLIVNADIDAAAAIADSKLAQIVTANKVAGSAVQLGANASIADNTGLEVQHAPKLQNSETAGEAFTAAGGPYAVRYGIAAGSETAGAVYKADPTELSVGGKDPFYVIGLAAPAADVSASGAINVVKHGPLTVTAHGFAVGEPIFLAAAGALTNTAPTTAGEAVVRIGMAIDANTIEVTPAQVIGVN